MSGTIQVCIDDLQSKEIITDKNIADLRRFISVKYPQNTSQKSAIVFADAIHRIIDRKICVMSDDYRKKVKQYLIENSIKKKSFSIHAGDIFDACLKISDEENSFMDEFYEWARTAMDTFIPKSSFYEFVDQLKQAVKSQRENNASKHDDAEIMASNDAVIEEEIYDFEYRNYIEKAIEEETDCTNRILLDSRSYTVKTENLTVLSIEPEYEEAWNDLEYRDYIEKAIEEEAEFINKIMSESPVQLALTHTYTLIPVILESVFSGIKTYSLDIYRKIIGSSKEIAVQKILLGTVVFTSVFTGTLYFLYSSHWTIGHKMQIVSKYPVPWEQTASDKDSVSTGISDNGILMGHMGKSAFKKPLLIVGDNKKPSTGGMWPIPGDGLNIAPVFRAGYGREPADIIKNCRRKLDMKATAYDLSVESCGKWPGDPEYGITASGVRAQKGRTVAVDPSVISLGSRVYISFTERYRNLDGVYIAEDTGGLVKGDIIDIFFGEDKKGERVIYNKALEFGVQRVKVYVLD